METSSEPRSPDNQLRVDAQRNRQRILAAARDAFATGGLDVTLDEIALRAGVGIGTVYRRFANKEALIDELFEERVAAVVAAAEEALLEQDAWSGLVKFLECRLTMETQDRGLHEILSHTSHGQNRTAQAREQIAPLVIRLVSQAQAQGTLRPDFVPQDLPVLVMMLGTAHDFTGAVAPDAWRRYFTILLDGVRTARSEPTSLSVAALSEAQTTAAMHAPGHDPSRAGSHNPSGRSGSTPAG